MAAGDDVRAARRAANDMEVGRVRARTVRERVVAMTVVIVDAVASRKLKVVDAVFVMAIVLIGCRAEMTLKKLVRLMGKMFEHHRPIHTTILYP